MESTETKIISKDEETLKNNAKKLDVEQRKEALLKHLTLMRNLVMFIDTKLLKNRQEKRTFWRDFVKDEKSRQAAILALLTHFQSFAENQGIKNEDKPKVDIKDNSGVASS